MLNELRDLSRSLIVAGIPLEQRHKFFKDCKKSAITCLVYLNQKGDISGFDFADFDVRSVRKWEQSNGCSFPAFNIPSLYKVTIDASKSEINKNKKNLEKGIKLTVDDINRLANSSATWDKKDIAKQQFRNLKINPYRYCL
jgi:hypothetical protein